MNKWTTCFVCIVFLAACGDNSAGPTPNMYDTVVHDAGGVAATRDSVTAAIAKDSAAAQKDSANKSMKTSGATTGGAPEGTIDSGMTNAGAQKPMKHKKK